MFTVFLFFCSLASATVHAQSNNCSYGSIYNGFTCVECGTTAVSPNIKIVGGIQAIPNSWPSQVLVVINVKGDYKLFNENVTVTQRFQCGGTLISQKTVMTAGHCYVDHFYYYYKGNYFYLPVTLNKYYPTWESMYTIYAGVHNITFLDRSQDPPAGGIKLSVKKIVKHPSFDISTVLNDIQLLVLTDLVQMTSTVRFACLPQKYSTTFPDVGTTTYASGWGYLAESSSTLPNILYNVRLTVYNSSYCSTVQVSYPKNWNSQICSGEFNGGKDTCQGDSGGGLYVLNSQLNKYIVAGITSQGEGCGRAGKPGIYTRISYYIDWIIQNWETSNLTATTSTLQTTTKTTTKSTPRSPSTSSTIKTTTRSTTRPTTKTTARTTIRSTTRPTTTTTRATTTRSTTKTTATTRRLTTRTRTKKLKKMY